MRRLIIVILAAAVAAMGAAGREFVHIFTSKDVYETCEDLWFKCLVLDDSTFSLSGKAQTAFVEIVSPGDSTVWREKYPVVGGECRGQAYVGDDWDAGVYRMYVHTSGSLGRGDSTLSPKRLLIVKELRDVQAYASEGLPEGDGCVEVAPAGAPRVLRVDLELDSADYSPRSRVRARLRVRDAKGRARRVRVCMSVYDGLYSYAGGELDLLSHCLGVATSGRGAAVERFLPDGPVVGVLKAGKRKMKQGDVGNQFINVFDDSNTAGELNIVTTGRDGRFEIPADMAAGLGRDILMKPVSGKELKPRLELEEPFDRIAEVRRGAKDVFFAQMGHREPEDSADYTGRRAVRLNELVVKGRAGRYPRRNKFMGYLDSLSTMHGGAWVCGCPAGHGMSFLNDYKEGYTHHLPGCGYEPVKRSLPVKGQSYMLIKYSGISRDDYVVDMQTVVYQGPRFSEEELLRMNVLWKARGFYRGHEFERPDAAEMELGLDDERNTLLWLPEGETDDGGELRVEFFCSDIRSGFVVRGFVIDAAGGGIGVFEEGFRVR